MAILEEIQAQAGAMLQPIPGPDPAGRNASLDPRFESVRATMASLDSPSGGEVVWPPILRDCESLLREVSKDLLIASYLGHARVQTSGWAGLAVALETEIGLLEQYWDTMFPPLARLRGRGNALDWFLARLEAGLPSIPLQARDRPLVELVAAQCKRLAAVAREKLGEFCPSMRGIDEALERTLMSLPALAPEPAASPSDATPAAPADAAVEPAPVSPPEQPAAAQPGQSQAASAPVAPPQPAGGPPPAATPPTSLANEVRARVADLLAPVSAESPVGTDSRFEPAYEAAKLEIAKLDSVTASEEPDWKATVANAKTILTEHSKDLLMAACYAFASYRHKGLRELPAGLMLIEGLVSAHGDDLFPSRPRGRGAALTWLVEALEFPLSEEKLVPSDRRVVLEFEAAVKAFAATTREKMGDHAPTTRGLADRAQRMLISTPEKKPDAAPAPRPTPASVPASLQPAARPAAASMPTVAGSVTDAADVTAFLSETGRGLLAAGNVLRGAQLADPASYRLVRVGLWLHMAKAPPAEAGGQTKIPAIPAPRRAQLETLAANEKYEVLVSEAEGALSQFRFLLDLNRFTWTALDKLGDAHFGARDAVAAEVATLLRRMPNLPDFTAADGSPLADGDTKKWLASAVLAGSGGSDVGGGDDGDDAALIAEIRGAMKSKPMEAMQAAKDAIESAPNPRARFLRQLGVAEICLDAGKPLLARGMFAGLEREMRERGLAEWDRGLAGRCLEGFVRSIRAAAKLGNKYPTADAVFERLCLADPQAAARLTTP